MLKSNLVLLLGLKRSFSNLDKEVAMKTFKVLVVGAIVSFFSFYVYASNQTSYMKAASCGLKNISIFYKDTADYLIGCEGIARTKNFFASYGYAVDVPIRIYFLQRVTVNISNPSAGREQVYGYFDPETLSVYISSITSPFVNDSSGVYLRIEYYKESGISQQQRRHILEELHRSVVTHEVAHLLAQHNFKLRSVEMSNPYAKMGHGVHEYIASIVQLSTMEATLRQRILQQYEPQLFFNREEQINIIFYACDPQKFNIMSFRHFHNKNKSQQQILLDRIFSNELNPDLAFEFDN